MKTKNYLFLVLFSILSIPTAQAFAYEGSEKVYEAQEPATTIIETLQNGESYSIEITSVGCFSGKRETVIVSKDADVITASFQDTKKILSDTDVEAFITFEHQLQSLQIGGCSTVDTYVIRYGSDEFRTSDGTCSWLGGKKLLEAIS